MPAELTQSSKPKLGIARAIAETILRWLAEIGGAVNKPTKPFLRQRHPASVVTTEKSAQSAAEEAGALVTAAENADAKATTTTFSTRPVTADVNLAPDGQISPIAHIALDQEEIQRRRELVRVLFNDFWSGFYDKPAAFVDRLNQAENYLNERLAARGESWQLDAKTRAMLGLPPRSNSAPEGKTA